MEERASKPVEADLSSPDRESTDELQRQLEAASAELQDIDGEIRDLRKELGQFVQRREMVAKRELTLRSQAEKSTGSTARPLLPDAATSAGPTMFSLGEDVETPESQAATPSRVAADSAQVEEDWDNVLDSFGVAKCGVCGMKLPLDTAEIEKHCLECEESQTSGRKLSLSEITARSEDSCAPARTIVFMPGASGRRVGDRASMLRERLASGSSVPNA